MTDLDEKELVMEVNRREQLYSKLRGGFFLSAMLDITDGAFCAQRSAGCSMVQLGIYLAEPPAYGTGQGEWAHAILPPEPTECTDFLAEECRKAKSISNVITCLNMASPGLEWALEAAESYLRGGGDLVELNVHGGYWRYLEIGKMRAMVLPENQKELFRWVEAFTKREVPLIVKFNGKANRSNILQVLKEMKNYDVFGIHVNVRIEKTKRPDIGFVRKIRERYPGFLLVSGYVRSIMDAKGLFEAGADMVGIAEPAVEDAQYIYRIAEEYKRGER